MLGNTANKEVDSTEFTRESAPAERAPHISSYIY